MATLVEHSLAQLSKYFGWLITIVKSRVVFVKKSVFCKNWFNSRVSASASKEDVGDKKSANHSRDKKYIINGKIRIPQMVS